MQLRYGVKRAVIFGISLCVLTPLVRAQEQCEPQAMAAAQKFVRSVFDGGQTGGSLEAFKEASDLAMEDGDAPAWPIVYVASYKIEKAVKVGKDCRVTVKYERLGTISEELTFRPAKSEETAHIWLGRDSGRWKVHQDTVLYGLPPHVGREAIKRWLRKFLEPPIDEKTVRAKELLKAISKYH